MEDQNPLIKTKYKSYWKIFFICLNATLSSFFVGYSLVYLGTIPDFQFIIDTYHIGDQSSKELTQSLVQGCVPIGAIFGALSSSQLLKRFSRKNGFLVTNIIALISLLIMLIHSPATIVIGRLLQGVCTGIYSAIVPLYINQIVTPDLTNLGTLNQIVIASSQAFSNLLYYILSKSTDSEQVQWYVLSEFLLLPIVLQTIGFWFFFPYETPKYLFEESKLQKASQLISLLYNEEYVEEAMTRFRKGTERSMLEDAGSVGVHSDFKEEGSKKYENAKLAIFFAVYLALLQQMSGVNAIVVYGKQAISGSISSEQIKNIIPILIALMPAITGVFTNILMKKVGRKFLIQLGTLNSCICLALVFIGFLIQQNNKTLAAIIISIGMILFMASFGLTLGPIVWLYIPQIVQPNILPFSTMANLIGATINIMIFPLIKKALPNQNPSFLFLIFLGWCVISLFVNWKCMVETKDKTRQSIFKEYKEKKVC